MKIQFVTFLLAAFIALPSMAEKPEWAGNKGKPRVEQKESHRSAMQVKEDLEEEHEKKEKKLKDKKQKKEKKIKGESEEFKGLDKQQAKKSEQVQKELDKGSEKGIEARDERKKWWKFWGE